MKIFARIALVCVLLGACATPSDETGALSAKPWDDLAQSDAMSREFCWGEEDVIYDGPVALTQPL